MECAGPCGSPTESVKLARIHNVAQRFAVEESPRVIREEFGNKPFLVWGVCRRVGRDDDVVHVPQRAIW